MNYDLDNIWHINSNEFPSEDGIVAQIKFLLRYAILAPSAHNTQPWRCRLNHNTLDVFLDRSKILHEGDPTLRETYLSLGAFVGNFCLAATAYNLDFNLEWLPMTLGDDGVARITLQGNPTSKPTQADEATLQAILNRRMNRSAYKKQTVQQTIVSKIVASTNDDELSIHVITKREAREKVGKLIALGTQFAFNSSAFRAELAHYITPNNSQRLDGIPGYTANLGFVGSFVMPFLIRNFNIGASQGRRDGRLFARSPLIVVLCSATDDPIGWLKVGYLYEKISLIITENGLSHSILASPIEPPMAPQKLQATLKESYRPQMVFRVGYTAKQPAHSPRRPVSDILIP